MRTLFIIPLVLMSVVLTVSPVHSMNLLCGFVGIGCETVTKEELFLRDGLYYKKFTNVPFTGEISGLETGSFKKGEKTGTWIKFHKNGQLNYKGNYEDGKRDGLWESYYENGQLFGKGNYKDGKPEDGLWENYRENGQLWTKTNYKDGKIDGPWEIFNSDGSLSRTDFYKDGQLVELN